MLVGLADAEITTKPGTAKIGFLRNIIGERVADPIRARAVVLSDAATAALVVLDTLSVRARHVAEIRRAIKAQVGAAFDHVMIAATHNHAGPALTSLGDVPVDDEVVADVTAAVVRAVTDAHGNLEPAEVGIGRSFNTTVAENRRIVMRDGTVRTHGDFTDPNALFVEGPIDAEVTLLGFRRSGGEPLGLLVGFACHPTDHGQDDVFSAGWPGVLTRHVEGAGWPHSMFLNGAFGNVATARRTGPRLDMSDVGIQLASSALAGAATLDYRSDARVSTASVRVDLPVREITPDEIAGKGRGAQRFVDPEIYERCIPGLVARLESERVQCAEVDAIGVGALALVGIPGELFVELGLDIKQRIHPRPVAVVGAANGMVGYVPHPAACRRGGYEVTFGPTSWLGPQAGEMLVDAAERVVDQLRLDDASGGLADGQHLPSDRERASGRSR